MFNIKDISLCVPVYNRKAYLANLLSSLETAYDCVLHINLQISISDNASTDDVSSYIRQITHRLQDKIDIVFNQFACNLGADVNYNAAGSYASNNVLWLMGSDDQVPPFCFSIISLYYDLLKSNVSIFPRFESSVVADPQACLQSSEVTHWLDYDILALEERFNNVNISKTLFGKTFYRFNLKNKTHQYILFKSLRSLGGLLTYLSSITLPSDAWNMKYSRPEDYGTLYSHSLRLIRYLLDPGNSAYLIFFTDPIVINRRCNDSFDSKSDKGMRILVDYNYIKILSNELNLQSNCGLALKLLDREWPLRDLFLRYSTSRRQTRRDLLPYLSRRLGSILTLFVILAYPARFLFRSRSILNSILDNLRTYL